MELFASAWYLIVRLILSSAVWLRKRSEAHEDKYVSGFATEIWIYGITKGE